MHDLRMRAERCRQHPQRAVARAREAAWRRRAPLRPALHRCRVEHLDAVLRRVRCVERCVTGGEPVDIATRAHRHVVDELERGGCLRMRIDAAHGGLEGGDASRIADLAPRDAVPLAPLFRPHARADEMPLLVADADGYKRIAPVDRDCIAAAVAPAVRAACEAQHLAVLIDARFGAALVPRRVGVDLPIGRYGDRGDVDLRPAAVAEAERIADP